MKNLIFLLAFMISSLFAQSEPYLVKKGKKIAHIMCDEQKLKNLHFTDTEDAKSKISRENICPNINDRQLKAVAAYAVSKDENETPSYTVKIPEDAKCPVCGMYVHKYPRWATYMRNEKKEELYFDGVKDMMKYIFSHKNEKFDPILVNDFYTLKPIDAKKAFFVIGSDVYGPMGEELIPFKNKDDAAIFLKEHKGKKIVTFDRIVLKHLY